MEDVKASRVHKIVSLYGRLYGAVCVVAVCMCWHHVAYGIKEFMS